MIRYLSFPLAAIAMSIAAYASAAAPPPAPTCEVILVMPDGGISDTQSKATERFWLDLIGTSLPPGTWVTVLDAATANPVTAFQVSEGARPFRLFGAPNRPYVKTVLDRLAPERAAVPAAVDYSALPTAVLASRRTALPIKLLVFGSPVSAAFGFTKDYLPCDIAIDRADSPFTKEAMGDFPAGTTVSFIPSRDDWGPSAHYRIRATNFWRLLIAARGAELLRITSDPLAAYEATTPQWLDAAKASGECTGPKPAESGVKQVEREPEPAPPTPPKTPTPAMSVAMSVPDPTDAATPPLTPIEKLGEPVANFVLVIDGSGSMGWPMGVGDKAFAAMPVVKRFMKDLVLTTPCERFAIVVFQGDENDKPLVTPYPDLFGGFFRIATPTSRAAAAQFIDGLVPQGGTPTLPALRAAAELPGVTSITLVTDGRPNLAGGPDEVLAYARELRERGVVVNVIGCGVLGEDDGDFDAETFLKRLAAASGGVFLQLDQSGGLR
jgi:hypothetical protein